MADFQDKTEKYVARKKLKWLKGLNLIYLR